MVCGSPRNLSNANIVEADALPCSYTKPNSSCHKPEVSTAPVHLSGKLAAIFNACLKRERRRAAFPCGAVSNGRDLNRGIQTTVMREGPDFHGQEVRRAWKRQRDLWRYRSCHSMRRIASVSARKLRKVTRRTMRGFGADAFMAC